MGTKDKASMTPEDKKMVMEMCKQFNGMSQIMKAEVMKCKSPELKQALMKAKDVCAPPGDGGKGSGSGGKKPEDGNVPQKLCTGPGQQFYKSNIYSKGQKYCMVMGFAAPKFKTKETCDQQKQSS